MNRRTLLVGSAAALAGCGASGERNPEPPPAGSDVAVRGDVELLLTLLELKERAAAAYERSQVRAAAGFAGIEREHADRIRRELARRHGRPPAGRPGEGRGAAHLADVEDTTIALLVDTLPKLSDPRLRALAARMLAVDAEQLAVLRRALGRPALEGAFVAGRTAL